MRRAARATGLLLVRGMLVATVVTFARRADAAPPRVRLTWSSPDDRCLTESALRQAVERTLGRQVFADDPGLAEVRGEIAPAGTGFRARISLHQSGQPTVQRTLSTGKVCGRLDESVAVVVALMIDTVLAPAEPVQMAVPDEPPAADAAAIAPPTTTTAVAPAGQPLTMGLALAGGVGHGVLPGWTPEAGLVARLRPSPWLGVEADLRWLATKRALNDGALGGDFSAWTATLRGCAGTHGARLRFAGCLGVGSGRLTGSGVGLNAREPPSGTLLFAAVTPARVGVRVAPHVWLSADASVRLMLRRERFGFLDTQGEFAAVHRPSLLAPVLSLAVLFESTP